MGRKDWDEICYPFIHEPSHLCDFEVVTDELCSVIGGILSFLPNGNEDIFKDLSHLQPLCWHLNGSIRGRLAINDTDIGWVRDRLNHYREMTTPIKTFVLPRGPVPVPLVNSARSIAKKAIRAMVRVEEEGVEVPAILYLFCNLLCNYLFALTGLLNYRTGFKETPFQSKSYGRRQ